MHPARNPEVIEQLKQLLPKLQKVVKELDENVGKYRIGEYLYLTISTYTCTAQIYALFTREQLNLLQRIGLLPKNPKIKPHATNKELVWVIFNVDLLRKELLEEVLAVLRLQRIGSDLTTLSAIIEAILKGKNTEPLEKVFKIPKDVDIEEVLQKYANLKALVEHVLERNVEKELEKR